MRLLTVEEQEETLSGKHKHTTEYPHAFAHAHDTILNLHELVLYACDKNGEIYVRLNTIIRLSLDNTGVSQQMAFIWAIIGCIRFPIISSKCCKTMQLLRSSGNRQTQTQTDFYNPLTT